MNIVIGNAWPYSNSKLHLGRIAVLLPGDVIARYHRMMGDNVIFISGSDAHGRLVLEKALEEGLSPKETNTKYHKEFSRCFKALNFSFDLFTSTETDYHKEKVKEFIKELYDKGYIYEKIAFERETNKESNHLFFKLSNFENDIKRIFIKRQMFRENAEEITKRYLEEGLRDRAVTKEIDWGVEVPIDGFSDKRIFVWIEAVMGYLTATMKVLEDSDEDLYDYWDDEDSKIYLVHGKDNIPFHTIIFPGILAALGIKNPNLSIVSSNHLKLEGKPFSGVKNWAVWVDYITSKYNVDSIRYYLLLNGPEDSDTDFKWRNFISLNNFDLVSELDNLYKDTIKCVNLDSYKRTLSKEDKSKILNLYFSIGEKIEEGSFRASLKELFSYIKDKNKSRAKSIDELINIANILEVFLPDTAKKIKDTFKIKESVWNIINSVEIKEILDYKPLFIPIDRNNASYEFSRLKEKRK